MKKLLDKNTMFHNAEKMEVGDWKEEEVTVTFFPPPVRRLPNNLYTGT
jgi:hypothetical protein